MIVANKRATGRILMVMEFFCIFATSMSTSWLLHCITVLYDVTIGGNWVKGA